MPTLPRWLRVPAALLLPGLLAWGSGPRALAPPGPPAGVLPGPAAPTSWTTYAEGGDTRLAILLTDPDSRWLALVHGLKAIGIPFTLTRDPAVALRHRVVLAYPALAPADPVPFERHVAAGGTLLALGPLAPALRPLFGVGRPTDGYRQGLDFLEGAAQLAGLDGDARERHLRLGLAGAGALGGRGWGTLASGATALAAYEDHGAAIVAHPWGQGTAYTFGMDFVDILYRGQSGRDEWFARAYVDAYEPAGDVFLRLLAGIYARHEPGAVTLGTVPEGRPLALLMTHDIDYANSLTNARVFAEWERDRGIRATYFLQTKTVKDNLDINFLTPAAIPEVTRLAGLGHEVASHSVSHSPRFAQLPLGDGTEQYPGYRPFVLNEATTRGATVLGELRVSKYLIDTLLPGASVVSFRPGYLANPDTLPQALQVTGYRYSSSCTAAGSLGHLPFRQTRDRRAVQDLPVWEFPLTLGDQAKDLMAGLPAAQDVAERLARYGGVCVVLIHPSNLNEKLAFEQAFVPRWLGRAWFGTLGEFGRWWEARDLAGVDVTLAPGRAEVALTLPEAVTGLVLRVPATWSPVAAPGLRTLGPGCCAITAPAGTATFAFLR